MQASHSITLIFLPSAIFFFMNSLPSVEARAAFSNSNNDRLSLLHFKDGITKDPLGALASWNHTLHFCDWNGIECDHRRRRVTVVELNNLFLEGVISPSIGNLTSLFDLYLVNNSLRGPIPITVGRIPPLHQIDLMGNYLTGAIPAELSNCTSLQFLRLRFNELTASIPSELGLLANLENLDLYYNSLTGRIPASFGNLSSLVRIWLSRNALEGSIPGSLGRIPNLRVVSVYENRISGTLPPSLLNLSSSLAVLSFAQNRLHGVIPENIGAALPNLEILAGGLNNLTGPLPASLSNASELQILDFPDNQLSGPMAVSFGTMRKLVRLNLGSNRLESSGNDLMSFIESLTNSTSLEVLAIDGNRFSGDLPDSIANLSSGLTFLSLGSNRLSGRFPSGIADYANLSLLSMEDNFFVGSIPTDIGKLSMLSSLFVYGNEFSGKIPSSIGNLTQLNTLHLAENGFSGSIPPELGNCQLLQLLNLSHNELSGTIPVSITSISSLSISLNLASNILNGSLTSGVGNLRSLGELVLSDNKLTGEIPAALSGCIGLERLRLDGNLLRGAIPSSLSILSGVRELDLSRNNLSGRIPEFLTNHQSLRSLNLSFNAFEGEVPIKGVFANASAVSILGNDKLCGGILSLRLPSCPAMSFQDRRKNVPIRIFVPLAVVGFLLLLLACILLATERSKRKNASSKRTVVVGPEQVSYAALSRATGGFSSSNLIGTGSFGNVYQGKNVCGEEVVAVKVLNRFAADIFTRECESMRNIRHRNLVKVLTLCSSIDAKGDEFKALVYEYMPNGNLDKWLHPVVAVGSQSHTRSLRLIERLNIAIDVACALEYLNLHCCEPVIIHCNLKPSNVLLDGDMVAHVGDFCLARFDPVAVGDVSRDQAVSTRIKGSPGYSAPEYGTGAPASISGDAYSYGILLLEMFTGKRPTDAMFSDGVTLHSFVSMAFPRRALEVVDRALPLHEGRDNENQYVGSDVSASVLECLVSVFGIAISCSEEVPSQRMLMKDACARMRRARDVYLGVGIHGRRRRIVEGSSR